MSSALSLSHPRGRIALAIAAVASVCAFAPSLARAADLCVDDSACLQAGGAKYTALEDALLVADAAPSADRIFVGPGTYAAPTTSGFSNTQYPVEIIGSGPGTILTGPTNTSPVLTVNDFSSVASNLAIVIPPENDGFPKTGLALHGTGRGLSITAQTSPANGTTGAVVGPGLLEGSTIMLPASGPKAGIQADTDARVSNVNVTAGQGIDVDGADVQIDRARITTTGIGVWSTRINTQLTNSLVRLAGSGGTAIAATTGISNADAKLTARNVTIAGDPGGSTIGVESSSSNAHTATVIVNSSIVRGVKYPLWRGTQAPGTANIGVLYSDYDASAVLSTGPGVLAEGAGNISSDPLFADALDFHPLAGSPVVDGGDPATFNDTLDLDGNPRVIGGRRDMGAYELQPQAPSGTAPASDSSATAPSSPAASGQSSPGSNGAAKDVLAPSLSGLRITPARFTARHGAAIRFKLSETAKVKIAIRRRAAQGSRFVKVGTLVRSKAAGAGSVAIKRRVGAAALRPGSYTATVTATDAAGNRSRAYVLKFRVVPA